MRQGRLEFDGDSETAISQHHALLSIDSSEYYKSPESVGDTAGKGEVTVLERQLLGPKGPTNHPRPEDVLTYRVKIRLNRAVDSPQVWFSVMADVGIPIYGMATAVGRQGRTFAAGDTLEIDVEFHPRLGGSTYRLVIAVTDRYGRESIWADPAGLLMYLAPRLGSSGYADLDANISVEGERLTDHEDPLMVTPTASRPLRTAPKPVGSSWPEVKKK
jgi:hypothetical protein